MNKDNKNSGFSLVELIIAIAVLAVSSFFLYGIERITNKERTGGC